MASDEEVHEQRRGEMEHDEQKQLVYRYLQERWMSNEHIAENDHIRSEPVTLATPKNYIDALPIDEFLLYIREACPDLMMTIDEIIADGSRFVVRSILQGTDTQGFRGRLPTGGQIVITGIHFMRFEHDHLMNEMEIIDRLEPLLQLGFVCLPKPPTVTLRRPGNVGSY